MGVCLCRAGSLKGLLYMHFVILDDLEPHLDLMRTRLEAVCASLGIQAEIGLETRDAQKVLEYARQAPEETVWLLDIALNGELNGIELCRRVREMNRNAYVIYVSAYQQYALECCQSHAFDFLLKPWTDEQLADCLRAVQREMSSQRSGTVLTAEMGTRTIRLIQENILYFSKDKMSVTAHCRDGKNYTWREGFEPLMKRLSAGMFFLCHRSSLVNLTAVREAWWSDDFLVLVSGEKLPVSRRKEAELKKLLREEGK